jgi:mannose-6-phosphate isomerase-like protein (cupin superfamily)
LENNNYNINLDVKYLHHEIFDIPKIVEDCREKWYNQTLTRVNNSVVRVGIIEGEFHWHKHIDDDEFFLVLQGKLFIDVEDKTFELTQGQGLTVSRNVMHRTRAPQKTVILMVENADIKPVGD